MNQLLPVAGVTFVVLLFFWIVDSRAEEPVLRLRAGPAGIPSMAEPDTHWSAQPEEAADSGFDRAYRARPRELLAQREEGAKTAGSARGRTEPTPLIEAHDELPYEESFGEEEGTSDAPFSGPSGK